MQGQTAQTAQPHPRTCFPSTDTAKLGCRGYQKLTNEKNWGRRMRSLFFNCCLPPVANWDRLASVLLLSIYISIDFISLKSLHCMCNCSNIVILKPHISLQNNGHGQIIIYHISRMILIILELLVHSLLITPANLSAEKPVKKTKCDTHQEVDKSQHAKK